MVLIAWVVVKVVYDDMRSRGSLSVAISCDGATSSLKSIIHVSFHSALILIFSFRVSLLLTFCSSFFLSSPAVGSHIVLSSMFSVIFFDWWFDRLIV